MQTAALVRTVLLRNGAIAPEFFIEPEKPLIKEYARVNCDEDARFSFNQYYEGLRRREGSYFPGHGDDVMNYGFTRTNDIHEAAEMLKNGDVLYLQNDGDRDRGGFTQYGVSHRLLVSNPAGLTGVMLKEGLIRIKKMESGCYRFDITSIQAGFLFYLLPFINKAVSIDDLLSANALYATVRFCGFTSWYGAFTLFCVHKGLDISSRNRDGINGTNVYRDDFFRAFKLGTGKEIAEFIQTLDPILFNQQSKGGKLLCRDGTAYKKRLIKTILRLL